jgi:hypothetical protein
MDDPLKEQGVPLRDDVVQLVRAKLLTQQLTQSNPPLQVEGLVPSEYVHFVIRRLPDTLCAPTGLHTRDLGGINASQMASGRSVRAVLQPRTTGLIGAVIAPIIWRPTIAASSSAASSSSSLTRHTTH